MHAHGYCKFGKWDRLPQVFTIPELTWGLDRRANSARRAVNMIPTMHHGNDGATVTPSAATKFKGGPNITQTHVASGLEDSRLFLHDRNFYSSLVYA